MESQKVEAGFAGNETLHGPLFAGNETLRGMLSRAVVDVLAARDHQVALGFDARHDDQTNDRGELANAAACYIVGYTRAPRLAWPWDMHWWKPRSIRENLVRAAALIIAEIERLDRRALRAQARRLHEERVQIGAQLRNVGHLSTAPAVSRSRLDDELASLGQTIVEIVERIDDAGTEQNQHIAALIIGELERCLCDQAPPDIKAYRAHMAARKAGVQQHG